MTISRQDLHAIYTVCSQTTPQSSTGKSR